MQNKIKIFSDAIKNAKTIAVVAHKNPDGDALCSVLAMARLIELNFGRESVCIYDGNVPDNLDNVPFRGRARFFAKLDTSASFDLVILMDYGTVRNIGGPLEIIQNAKCVIEIDHHKNDEPIGQLCIDDEDAAATGIIVYEMMRTAKWKYDLDVLKLLGYTILTDTGTFKFIRTSAPLRIMADLVDAGVSIRSLMDSLNNKPRKTIQTEAAAAANAEFFYRGRLAVATIRRADYKRLDGRGETVLNLLAQIKGVEYIVLIKEQRENQIGLSFRGRTCPVDAIATAFGGGGHTYAAGAIVRNESLDDVRKRVLEYFKGEMK